MFEYNRRIRRTCSSICKVIAGIPLFSGLTEDKIGMLADVCSVNLYTIGKPVISGGVLPDSLYVIISGTGSLALSGKRQRGSSDDKASRPWRAVRLGKPDAPPAYRDCYCF